MIQPRVLYSIARTTCCSVESMYGIDAKKPRAKVRMRTDPRTNILAANVMDCGWSVFADPTKRAPDDRYLHIAFVLQDAATSGLVPKTEYNPAGSNTWAHDRMRAVLRHKGVDLRRVMQNALCIDDEVVVWIMASHGVYVPMPHRTAMAAVVLRAHNYYERNLHATLQSLLEPHGIIPELSRIVCIFLIAASERTCLCWFCQ